MQSFRGIYSALRPQRPLLKSAGRAWIAQIRYSSSGEDAKSEPEPDPVDSSEEELVKWDPEAKNPLHLQVTFEDVSRAVYKIRSGA